MLPLALDAHKLVDEHGEPVVFHVVADDATAYGSVVVSKDAESLRACESAEEFRAATGGFVRHFQRQRAAAYEVTCDQQEVGLEGVDPCDDVFEKVLLGVLLQVDVRELDNAEAVKGGRQVADEEGGVGDLELVAADLVGVEGEGCGGGDGSGDEVATGEQGGLSRWGLGRKSSHKE